MRAEKRRMRLKRIKNENWIPAYAGIDEQEQRHWIPACAGMTRKKGREKRQMR